MNPRKFAYTIISAILVLSFVSLASGFPSWFDESRLPTPRWTFTPRPTFTIPHSQTITIPTTVHTTIPTTYPTITTIPTPDGTSWFDESRLPTPRVTFTPGPTITIPFSRTITVPTTKPTPIPTTVPTATTTPAPENPRQNCKELTVMTWTGDYEYGVAGAKVYILLKGCPPGQYCKEDYNYFFVGTTDINGKLVLDMKTNSNIFRAESPMYSYGGGKWHFTGTAEKDPDACQCCVNIRLDEKIIDAIATPTPTWPDVFELRGVGPVTIWTADRQYTVPGAKLYVVREICPPGQNCLDIQCHYVGTAGIDGTVRDDSGNLVYRGNYAESPVYSRPGDGSWYYTSTSNIMLLNKKVIVSN